MSDAFHAILSVCSIGNPLASHDAAKDDKVGKIVVRIIILR